MERALWPLPAKRQGASEAGDSGPRAWSWSPACEHFQFREAFHGAEDKMEVGSLVVGSRVVGGWSTVSYGASSDWSAAGVQVIVGARLSRSRARGASIPEVCPVSITNSIAMGL